MQQNLDRIQYAIGNEQTVLTKLAATYSIWDETYSFVEDANQDYITNYFADPIFVNSEINVFAVIDNAGQIIHVENYNLEQKQEEPLSDATLKTISGEYLLSRDTGKGKTGLLDTIEGPLLFGTGPILTSQGEGPLRGTVLMGRFLDKRLTAQLSQVTKLPVAFYQLRDFSSGRLAGNVPFLSLESPVSIQPLDSKTLAGYFLISDIFGSPYLVAGMETPRAIFSQYRVTLVWLLACVALGSALIILVIVRFMDSMVLNRLKVLSQFAVNVSRDGNLSSRVSLPGQDELTALSDEMNNMLSKLSAANDRLLENENKYSTLVEKSNDGIILVINSIVVYSNSRMLQILGQTKEEFLGSNFVDFVNLKYRDQVGLNYHNRLSGKIVEESYEIEIDNKKRKSIPVEVNAKMIKLSQQDCDMVIIRDITERKQAEEALKQSEQKYRSLVNNIKFGLFRTSPVAGGRFLEINQAMELITGYSREELMEMPVVELYAEPVERRLFVERIISIPQQATHELFFKKKDKTRIMVSITASAVKDENGKVIYLDGIIEDITERKLLETKINDLYEKEKIRRQELQEEAQTKTLFIDILAHELKNPLTPIISASEMLQDTLKSDSSGIQQRLVATLNTAAKNLGQRLDELLDLARYSRGTFTLNRQPTRIKAYLEDICSRFKPSIAGHNQNLIVEIAEDLPLVEIDPSRLEQVLINLLSNAAKYSPDTSNIQFKACLCDGALAIEVKDEGIGISPEDQKKLFQPYQRLGPNRKKISGLGLGTGSIPKDRGSAWRHDPGYQPTGARQYL